MHAIRQIQQVVDGKIVVQLPDDFPAIRVEVIVLPAEPEDGIEYTAPTPSEDQGEILRKGRRPDEPRVFGAFEGLGWMADDFNTMPEEELALFYTDITIRDHKNIEHQP
jgi:hypothetical protein